MRNSTKWWVRIAGMVVAIGFAGSLATEWPVTAQSPSAPKPYEGVYGPAHGTIPDAIREFLGYRPTPQQPIAFTHKVHLANGLVCVNCHVGVDTAAEPRIPGVSACMTCHVAIATDKPEIKKIAAYQAKGQDIPWERVYGFTPEVHVHFNHAPHIRAGVNCTTCHGDMTQATVAQRTVNHTMGFCVTCHRQNKASIDCVTCHY